MAPFGDRAGMASAMPGTLQFGIAGLVSYGAGILHDGTALPLVPFGCGAAAFVRLKVLTRSGTS